MTRLVLLNPNTSKATTAAMAALARAELAQDVDLREMTVAFGVPLILDEAGLASAAEAVVASAPEIRALAPDGIIVSAFGDPGLARLRERLDCPATGLAEGAFAEAATDSLSFAVVTTTPDLAASIAGAAERYGHAALFRGCVITPGDPRRVMADPEHLLTALEQSCREAIRDFGVEAIVIGGGPLATAARQLRARFAVRLIEPVPAAARLAMRRAAARTFR